MIGGFGGTGRSLNAALSGLHTGNHTDFDLSSGTTGQFAVIARALVGGLLKFATFAPTRLTASQVKR